MARHRQKELIRCEFFEWRVGLRTNGYFYADGRSNKVDAGRYSLGTADRDEALSTLKRLDRETAVRFGMADSAVLKTTTPEPLGFDLGTKLYLGHVARPAVAGGAAVSTQKRYRAVFDKFGPVMKENGVRTWLQVDEKMLNIYATWLEDKDYGYATQYLELNTIKQAINWFVHKKHLPESCRFEYPLKAPEGTDTYCYTFAEVSAMVTRCSAFEELRWLGEVIIGLAHTGLRISELAALRWADIDIKSGLHPPPRWEPPRHSQGAGGGKDDEGSA